MTGTRIVTIICWIVSALVLTGLLIWLLTSVIFGGWGFFSDINIFGINIGGGIENLSGSFEARGVRTESTAGVHSINVNWVAGEVTVTPYDGNEIKITEYAQRELRSNEQMSISTASGTLRIDFRERGRFRGSVPRKHLEVLVPHELSSGLTNLIVNSTSGSIDISGFDTTNLEASSVSGAVTLSNIVSGDIEASTTSGRINSSTIRAGRFNANTVSGSINITEANVPNLNISTISGAMTVSGELDRVDSSTISGSVDISSSTVPGRIDSSSISGSVSVYIPNTGEITVSHSAVSGRFSSDIPVIMQSNASYSFSSVSGSTNIYVIS
ncbi:MAG: DUF4097 domain-containing protein [Oscillospiraceae bacterium]|nr:DUF4097 domain-containing protein [Oscillospiraceae bacterium]